VIPRKSQFLNSQREHQQLAGSATFCFDWQQSRAAVPEALERWIDFPAQHIQVL
jgi:hypothetical protein